MRSTIIPAQITTVEDKIAGSLNLYQILLLLFPVFSASMIYAFFPPEMKLSSYKIGLAVLISMTSIILAIRHHDKILLEWLFILFRFYRRPTYYLNDKNDLSFRSVYFPEEKETTMTFSTNAATKSVTHPEPSVADLIKLNRALSSKKLAVSFEYGKRR
jgi:hypothetical protein